MQDVFFQAIRADSVTDIEREVIRRAVMDALIARKRYAVQFWRKRLHDLKEIVDDLA
jgi:hypothetical protein